MSELHTVVIPRCQRIALIAEDVEAGLSELIKQLRIPSGSNSYVIGGTYFDPKCCMNAYDAVMTFLNRKMQHLVVPIVGIAYFPAYFQDKFTIIAPELEPKMEEELSEVGNIVVQNGSSVIRY